MSTQPKSTTKHDPVKQDAHETFAENGRRELRLRQELRAEMKPTYVPQSKIEEIRAALRQREQQQEENK